MEQNLFKDCIIVILIHCTQVSTALNKNGESSTTTLLSGETSSVNTTLQNPIVSRSGKWTIPFKIPLIIPEIETIGNIPQRIPDGVVQGLVVTVPTLITIRPSNMEKKEVVNKTVSNNMNNTKDTEISRLDENALIYGNKRFADLMYNYVVPTILGTCLVTTLIFTVILGKRLLETTSQISKATCVLLIAVAIADILTMASALAEIGWLFSQTNTNNMFLPPGSCRIMLILERISAIPHAASTWFTVILAIQRYMCVSRPFSAGRYVKIKSSCLYILTVCVLITALHLCRFFDRNFFSVHVHVSASPENETINTCRSNYADWVKDPVIYESLFAWLRIALTQFIPCILIVCFVYLMIRELRKTTQKTMQMDDSKLSSDRRQLSVFVILVAIIVFCVEVSTGVFLCFSALGLSTGHEVFSYKSLKTASMALDLILYVSYFVIFLLYCLMSKEVRRAIMPMCCIRKRAGANKSSASDSISSKKTTTSTPPIPIELKEIDTE